jgi:hypothetical protein
MACLANSLIGDAMNAEPLSRTRGLSMRIYRSATLANISLINRLARRRMRVQQRRKQICDCASGCDKR